MSFAIYITMLVIVTKLTENDSINLSESRETYFVNINLNDTSTLCEPDDKLRQIRFQLQQRKQTANKEWYVYCMYHED